MCPECALELPPGLTCLKHFLREASSRHPNQMPKPPQFILSIWGAVASTLSLSWVPELLTLSQRDSPACRGLPIDFTLRSFLNHYMTLRCCDLVYLPLGEGIPVMTPIQISYLFQKSFFFPAKWCKTTLVIPTFYQMTAVKGSSRSLWLWVGWRCRKWMDGWLWSEKVHVLKCPACNSAP